MSCSLDVDEIVGPMKKLLDSGETASYSWRVTQLQNLRALVQNHWTDLTDAIHKDLGKTSTEASMAEVSLVITEIQYALSNLKAWMKDQPVASPLVCAPMYTKLSPRPLQAPALIIGPFNYPVLLTLQPLVGALAAGNPVVVKPSELTPHVATRLSTLVPNYFDDSALSCVTGGIPETTKLLERPWGKILFTGSPMVGSIVATAAAKTLTPVILELGGKCATFVDETCPQFLTQVASRIIWSKTLNCGQTCAATDTLVVHESILPDLLPKLEDALARQFTKNPKQSDLGRIVSPRHAERLQKLIQEIENESPDKILVGGVKECDTATKYVAPTLVLNPSPKSRLMTEEIFGPILPIISVKSREEGIEFMRSLPGTPLCLYIFTKSDKVFETIRKQVPSGSCMRNDCMVHLASQFIPFGGLGTSGYGCYHGKYSFDAFSFLQPVAYRPCFPGVDLNYLRFHPFGPYKQYVIEKLLVLFPGFPSLHGIRPVVVVAVLGLIVLPNLPSPVLEQVSVVLRPILESLLMVLEWGAQCLRDVCEAD